MIKMPLPHAVKKAKDDAIKAFESAYPSREPEGQGDTPAGVTQNSPDVEGQPPAATAQPAPATPAADTVAAVQPGDTANPTETGDDDSPRDYEQLYKTLKGKYDAEVPHLSGQLRDVTSQLSNTQNILASLGTINSDLQFSPSTVQSKKILTDEEVENYGTDLISVMKKAAQEEFGGVVDQLREENKYLRNFISNAGQAGSASAKDAMYSMLNTHVPDWEKINIDKNFLDWLGKPDLYSGTKRQSLLSSAFERGDANTVINFFKGFKSEHTSAPVTQAQSTPAVVEPAVNLDTLVAPGRPNASSESGAQDGKSVYTHAGIAEFYNDVRLGKFNGREAERKAIEQDIMSATVEGRVVS